VFSPTQDQFDRACEVLDAYREIAASASIVDDVTLYRATC